MIVSTRSSVCLLLNELSEIEEHWPASPASTALFPLSCSLQYRLLTLYCSYFIGFSFNLPHHNFYEGHRFFSFFHYLYFCKTYIFSALDNLLYSPLLGRPKMIKIMSKTSIQHSLLTCVKKFSIMSSRDLWRHFYQNYFTKWVGLVPTRPYFKDVFVKTFSMMKY